MSHEPELMQAQDLWEFKQVMARESFFDEGHIRQVDPAYTFFLEQQLWALEGKAQKDEREGS